MASKATGMDRDTVGVLRGVSRGRAWTARLTLSAGWRCDDEDILTALASYEPDAYRLLVDPFDQLAWGVAALRAAAKALDAKATVRPDLLVHRQK